MFCELIPVWSVLIVCRIGEEVCINPLFDDEHTKVPEKLIFYSENVEIWKILCFLKLDDY